jgi:hypothetical protein
MSIKYLRFYGYGFFYFGLSLNEIHIIIRIGPEGYTPYQYQAR